MDSAKMDTHEFIGFDLGHGESAVARSYAGSTREPEILEFQGERSFVTAVARDGKSVRIGAQAVNLSATNATTGDVYLKFKSKDVTNPTAREATTLFTKTLFSGLAKDKKIQGMDKSWFYIGCPSGWDEADRDAYQKVLQASGLKKAQVVPESRAALMTALEQGYLSLEDTRSSVLIVDIGSSTTDFTYCVDLNAEDIGHNILGSGLLDTLIFERNLARQTARAKIEKLLRTYPNFRPVMEYWCRLAKEQYFNGEGNAVELIKRLPVGSGVLFEIRMDKDDAKAILNAPIKDLNNFTWPATFDYALGEAHAHLQGRTPQIVLLTGGASRLPLVGPACEAMFPGSKIVRGAEPEYAIARGLSWLGRFEYLHNNFNGAVEAQLAPDGPIYDLASKASAELGQTLAPVLVDALIENCVLPAFAQWRSGQVDTLKEVETVLDENVKSWLVSNEAQSALRPVIDNWFEGLQRDIETITDPLCREYGLPAMVLSLDDSTHVTKHLDGLNVAAPNVASLEGDTAFAGTTISTILIGVLLAKANLLAPLLANPVGLALGGAIGVGGFFAGKKALKGKMRNAKIPVPARKLVTDGRVRRAARSQRAAMIETVAEAWSQESAARFTDELVTMLKSALIERANERAVLFMI